MMPLGSHIPAWLRLQDALRELVQRIGATDAVVLDESNCVWCTSGLSHDNLDAIKRLYEREVEKLHVPLRRGGRLSVARSAESPANAYLAESFGGFYILALWFNGAFEPALARARVRRELPRIERLTLALPPPDGPDSASAAGRMRA
jgi:hypothetical protein